MEAAKCKLCGEKHWGLCPSLKGKVISKSPPKNLPKKKPAVAVMQVQSTLVGDPEPNAAGSNGTCPVCAARRHLKALQMQRYRAKKESR